MMLKWTMESVIAALAVVITMSGSVGTTIYQLGQINTQVTDLQGKHAEIAAHVAKHDDQLDAIKQQGAAMKQSVDDIKDVVHDIQDQVRKSRPR
jgi:predicted  nucleic acid-binding Zn-ribbon protein